MMRTTAKTVLLALAVSLVIAAAALFIICRFLLPQRQTRTPAPAYVIGAWEGKVAVFEGDADYPMQVFDTDVQGLPSEQRDELLVGIPVEDAERLYLLLEDYTS